MGIHDGALCLRLVGNASLNESINMETEIRALLRVLVMLLDARFT